jgi:hypothetical protein
LNPELDINISMYDRGVGKRLPADVLEWFRKQGAKGGAIGGSEGGKAAASNMTKEQRVARAKKAVAARETRRAVRNRSRRSP